jgi:hypothetical protein
LVALVRFLCGSMSFQSFTTTKHLGAEDHPAGYALIAHLRIGWVRAIQLRTVLSARLSTAPARLAIP